MYARGHEHGTRTQTASQSSWYAAIEAQNIARIEAQDDAERTLTTALAHQVGNAVTAMPEAAARITKAAALVQAGDVYPLTSGSYLVGSQDTQAAYLVRRGPWSCECPDHTHRQHLCKHIIAVQLTIRIGATYQPTYELAQAA